MKILVNDSNIKREQLLDKIHILAVLKRTEECGNTLPSRYFHLEFSIQAKSSAKSYEQSYKQTLLIIPTMLVMMYSKKCFANKENAN